MKRNNTKLKSNISFRQYLLPADTTVLSRSRSKYALNGNILSPQILMAIQDQSYCSKTISLSQKIIKIYEKINKIIRPDQKYLFYLNILLMLIFMYYIIQIGLLIGFGNVMWQDQLSTVLWLNILFVLVLTFDILISPIKAYYQQGLLINDVPLIFRKYIKKQFWIDIIGLFSVLIPLIFQTYDSNIFKLFWLFKLYTAHIINIQLNRSTQLNITLNTIYLVCKLIFFCFCYAHFFSIGFYLVSLWVYNNNYYGPNTPNISWVYNSWAISQMVFLPWTQRYAYIMYYGIAVVSTIAYGDITPRNPIECIYTIFALIIVTIIFGYLLTQILRLLITVFGYSFSRRFHHFQLNTRLKQSLISRKNQQLIRKHIEQIDREEQFRNRQIEQKILNFLPADPLYGLLLIIYNSFLNQMGFTFVKQLNYQNIGPADQKSSFLEHFMKTIRQERHFIGDILYNEGDIYQGKSNDNCAYFYIKEIYKKSIVLGVGQLKRKFNEQQIQFENNNKSYELKMVDKICGEVQFLNGQSRSHWAVCIKNCILLVASRQSLIQFYDKLTIQQKQIVCYNRQILPSKQCFICKQPHQFQRCYWVFAQNSVLQQSSKSVVRRGGLRSHNRTKIKSVSPWVLFKDIRQKIFQITKSYKRNLLRNRHTQQIFVDIELDDQNDINHEDLEQQLRQTEILLQSLQNQQLDQLGLSQNQWSCEVVYDFKHYKKSQNITSLSKIDKIFKKIQHFRKIY